MPQQQPKSVRCRPGKKCKPSSPTSPCIREAERRLRALESALEKAKEREASERAKLSAACKALIAIAAASAYQQHKDTVIAQGQVNRVRHLLATMMIKYEDHTECALCEETILEPSFVVECGHAFDTKCLHRHFTNSRSQSQTRETPAVYACPTCHVRIVGTPLVFPNSWVSGKTSDRLAELRNFVEEPFELEDPVMAEFFREL